MTLLLECDVHRVLIEAIHELDEVCLQEIEMLGNSNLKGLERLRDELLFVVLRGQGEDVYDYDPAWLDEGCLHSADVGEAHDYVLLDVRPGVQVVQHDPLKWLQEILLKVEARELLLDQELVRKLSERIDCEDCDHQVRMGADPDEMFAKHLPDLCPHKSDSSHVEIGDLNNRLQAELPRVHGVWQFDPGYLAEVLNEADDSILVEVDAAHKDRIQLCNWEVLDDKLRVSLERLLTLLFCSRRLLAAWWCLTALLLRCAVRVEEVAILHLSATHIDHFLESWDLLEDELPWIAQVVSLVRRQLKDLLNDLDVLLLDLLLVSDWGELSEWGDKRIPLGDHIVVAAYLDWVGEPFDAESSYVCIIRLFQDHGECCQVGGPYILKERPDRLAVVNRDERIVGLVRNLSLSPVH